MELLPCYNTTRHRPWKTKHDLGISELRSFFKHLRLSKRFRETNLFTISQTRKFLQKVYIPGFYGQRRSKRLTRGSGRLPGTLKAAATTKSIETLSHSGLSGSTFGIFGPLNFVSFRSRSRSLSQRRSSLSLQLQLPSHSFLSTSFCPPADSCFGPFTPHSQILHTPPFPPEMPRHTKRGTPRRLTSPPYPTNASLTPIFEASVSGMNWQMSPVAPTEAIRMHAPRRLSYSRAPARKNSLTTSNYTDYTLSGEKVLASPVTIKSSSCTPESPTEVVSRKDSFFSFQGSPTALKV